MSLKCHSWTCLAGGEALYARLQKLEELSSEPERGAKVVGEDIEVRVGGGLNDVVSGTQEVDEPLHGLHTPHEAEGESAFECQPQGSCQAHH